MIPIYEQRSGRGIGHNVDSFFERFDRICASHLEQGRASAFAFVLYDFQDAELRKLLKDQGVFANLDRLTGRRLSLFYLHSGRPAAIRRFNSFVRDKLGIPDDLVLPCVIFFRARQDEVCDPLVVQLDQADVIHGFHELYTVVERYLDDTPLKQPAHLRWVKGAGKLVGVEFVRASLRLALEHLLF